MIDIKNLTKKFNNNTVLNNIEFSVKKGEILGFLGPNGAGKTTTMKMITSFLAPTSGSVLVDGVDTQKDTLATRSKIGYLPEMVPLYDDMLVFEYLRFIADIRNIKPEQIDEKIKEAAKACGLAKVLKRPIDELSKGYRQRVGLAQAIIHDPDILILDEPTTGLDPNQIIEIRDLIKKIGQEKTVIFSTHILSEASAICDRIIIINKGGIVAKGTPKELKNQTESGVTYYIKIKGDKEKVLERLKVIKDVKSVKAKDKEADNIYLYVIEPESSLDLRENISRTVMTSGWPILHFTKKSVSLEDVFRELTR